MNMHTIIKYQRTHTNRSSLNVFKKRHIKNMENKLRYPNANITIGWNYD